MTDDSHSHLSCNFINYASATFSHFLEKKKTTTSLAWDTGLGAEAPGQEGPTALGPEGSSKLALVFL